MRPLSEEAIALVYDTMTKCRICGYTKLCKPNECECCGRYDDGECYECVTNQERTRRSERAAKIRAMSRDERRSCWLREKSTRKLNAFYHRQLLEDTERFLTFTNRRNDLPTTVFKPTMYKVEWLETQ